ncbi:DMT family transporter [Sulfuriferula sp. GW1]|uniref:DMT family transporter n=1 Tax=Sulfuriferula sp. GW1 TaxID=3345111 RepID=UPI0039AF11CC
MAQQRNPGLFTGMLALLLAAVLWGGMFPVAKSALVTLDAFWLTLIRYGSGALLFVALLAAIEGRSMLRFESRVLSLWAYGTAGFAGFSILAFLGLSRSQPEHGAIIMALMPLLGVLVNALWRGVRPTPLNMVAIVLALGGVALVITKGHLSALLHGGEVRADLLILAGALCWVIYTLGAQDFPGWSPLRYTSLSCLMAVPSIVGITLLATLAGIAHVPSASTLAGLSGELIYMILFAGVVAVLAWNMGIKTLGAGGVLFINFVPVTALIIGWLQGHRLSAAELTGALIVMGALVLGNLGRRPAARAPQSTLCRCDAGE